LSPFDPVDVPRLRCDLASTTGSEIYTPPPKRQYGYYVLPFLLGDELVGRADLKADRATALLCRAHGPSRGDERGRALWTPGDGGWLELRSHRVAAPETRPAPPPRGE
jgi:hypothetical protein